LREYVSLVRRLDAEAGGGALRHYPGSPLLASTQLRPQDRAVFVERNAAEAVALRHTLQGQRQVSVQTGDGYQALRSQLPPPERRGLVLIDPPYEAQEAEFGNILRALPEAHGRWPTGVYAVWYPIKRRSLVAKFHARVAGTGLRKILCAELCLYPDDSRVSLNGCGLLILNPTWQLDHTLAAALPALHRALGGRPGTRAECFWLVPE
jgi:23S rRNA (adenine2030-N6)-methyltransferase